MGNLDYLLNEQTFVIAIISLVLFIAACAGIAIFITYSILRKIDFGDVVCSIHQYSNNGIKYSVNRDNVLLFEKNEYMLVYGDNPYENIERSIPDQLLKNAEKTEDNRGQQLKLSH